MKKVLTIVGSVLLGVLLLWGYHSYQQSEQGKQERQKSEQAKQERQKYENMGYYTGKWEIDSYEFLEDGRGVAVHWKSLNPDEDRLFAQYNPEVAENFLGIHGASNQRYIVRKYFRNSTYRGTQKLPKEDPEVYYAMSIYRIDDQKLEGSQLDLYKLVEDYNPDYVPETTGGIIEKDGKDYISIQVYKRGWELSQKKQLWLNLESKQIDWEDTKIQQFPKSPSVDLGPLKDKMEEMTVMFGTTTVFDKFYQNQLSFHQDVLKGSVLETAAPKVYQLLSKQDSQFYLLIDSKIYNHEVYGDVLQFLDLYQLFVPANTNLYEGLTIPAELSKDGQEHSVNSKEEFDLYYDVAKDRELNKQRRILVEKGE